MLNEAQGGESGGSGGPQAAGGGGGGGSSAGQPGGGPMSDSGYIQVTPEEKQAIERVSVPIYM